MNKVRKYNWMCDTVDSLYAAIETKQQIYFVKCQNIILEIQWMVLSMENISWGIFRDGCDGSNCMDTAVTRSTTQK